MYVCFLNFNRTSPHHHNKRRFMLQTQLTFFLISMQWNDCDIFKNTICTIWYKNNTEGWIPFIFNFCLFTLSSYKYESLSFFHTLNSYYVMILIDAFFIKWGLFIFTMCTIWISFTVNRWYFAPKQIQIWIVDSHSHL